LSLWEYFGAAGCLLFTVGFIGQVVTNLPIFRRDPSPGPTAKVWPVEARRGSSYTIRGTGLPPGKTMVVYTDFPDESQSERLHVEVDGAGEIGYAYDIPPELPEERLGTWIETLHEVGSKLEISVAF
jgi:hypothetical protein